MNALIDMLAGSAVMLIANRIIERERRRLWSRRGPRRPQLPRRAPQPKRE